MYKALIFSSWIIAEDLILDTTEPTDCMEANAHVLLYNHCWQILSTGPNATLPEYDTIFDYNAKLSNSSKESTKFWNLRVLIEQFHLIPIHPQYLNRKWKYCQLSDVREVVEAIDYLNMDGIDYEGAYLAKAIIKALESIGNHQISKIPHSDRFTFIQDAMAPVIIYFQMNIGYNSITYPLCIWFLDELHKLDQLGMIKEAVETRTVTMPNVDINSFSSVLCHYWINRVYQNSTYIVNEISMKISYSIGLWQFSRYQESMQLLMDLKSPHLYINNLSQIIFDFATTFGFFGDDLTGYQQYKANCTIILG